MQNICRSTLHPHLNKAHQTNQMAEKMTEDYNVPELIDQRMYWSNFDSQ